MSVRKLIVGLVATGLFLVAPAGSAWAQEEEPTPISEADEELEEVVEEEEGDHSHLEECILEANEGGTSVEECVEAPNPILPELNEIIWGGLAFLILFVLMAKFAYPPIRKGMQDRTERIRGDLDAADSAKQEAQQTLDQYQVQLADAKAEANRIIEEARQVADGMRQELQERAEADIAELRQRAAADVEAAKSRAVADLQSEVAALAIGAAEVVVEKSLDRQTQTELVENYINRVGSSS